MTSILRGGAFMAAQRDGPCHKPWLHCWPGDTSARGKVALNGMTAGHLTWVPPVPEEKPKAQDDHIRQLKACSLEDVKEIIGKGLASNTY